jgi:hypothetical protein
MQLRGLKLKQAQKIVVCLMVIMLLSPLWVADPGTAGADTGTPATSLTLKTGYSGGTFTTAKVFTDSDFSGATEQGYSFMDSMPSPVMDAARGIPLTSLLASAGINAGNVSSLAFWTTDSVGSPFKTLPMPFFNSPGYYYPNEMEYWNATNKRFTDANGVDQTVYAKSQAVPVVPMMCIADNWERGAMAPDFSALNSSNKYRLVFGQSGNPAAVDAPDSAKYVYEIDVTLNGTAVTGVTLNKTSDTVPAGSTDQLTASIIPAGAINQGVTWTSNNAAVATVSGAGLVTAATAGSANITVTTEDGGKTAVCAVMVTSSTGGGGGGAAGTSVSLTAPASGQVFNPGDEVTISGTAQGLPAVSVTVTDPNGKAIYTGSDLNAGSGGFTTSFTLSGDAATGDYTIGISGTGLANSLTQTFTVSAGAVSTATTNPVGVTNFGDLQNCWAQQQITDLVARGVLRGMTPTEFMPDANITRAQFATMLDGILKLSPQQGVGPPFNDVAPGAWYYDNVSAAVYAGLISGYGNGLFGPEDPITREQMASMVARTLQMKTKLAKPDQPEIATILARFQDQGSISDWAKADVALAVQQGIIHGRTGDTFAPQAKATRAEAAVMIWQLVASLQQAGGAAPAPAS